MPTRRRSWLKKSADMMDSLLTRSQEVTQKFWKRHKSSLEDSMLLPQSYNYNGIFKLFNFVVLFSVLLLDKVAYSDGDDVFLPFFFLDKH